MPKTATVDVVKPRRAADTRLVWMLGPALVAGVAYLDPGNVASNMTAGALFGYLLVWVVVAGNLMAWLVQYLSAKLGIVTGRSLPQLLGERIRRPWARRAYWLQAELVAMATDIAEVIGGAVALNLLFGLPLVYGGAITGAVSVALLMYQSRRGARAFEVVVIGMLLVIAIGFCAGIVVSPPDPAGVAAGLVPRFEGTQSVLLAASILGATIMPHAIYAHSALTRDRFHPAPAHPQSSGGDAPLDPAPATLRRSTAGVGEAGIGPGGSAPQARGGLPRRPPRRATTPITRDATAPTPHDPARIRALLRATRWDVTVAMAVAGTVNVVMLLLAASSLAGVPGTDSLEGAYTALRDGVGPAVATLFAVGLLASGLASTAVGAYAGSEIMSGLLRVRVPVLARRLVTLVPALAVLAAGIDPTWALVLSQVVLSFGIPFALVPLVWLSARRGVLGRFRNRALTTVAGAAASALLIALNGVLLWLVATGG